MSDTDAIIQKVSSGLDVLISEVRGLRNSHEQLFSEFTQHRKDDRDDFNRAFLIIETNRKDQNNQFETNRKDRNNQFERMLRNIVTRLDAQDEDIKANAALTNKARGASTVIIAIAAFLGSVLLVVLTVVLGHYWGGG